MKYRYTKYTGDLLDQIDLEDLVSRLSDLLLSSGFNNPWGDPSTDDEDRSMQALHDAILEALFSGGVLSDEALQQLLGEPADGDQEGARQKLEELIQQIIERMMEQGFVTGAPDLQSEREQRQGMGGRQGDDQTPVKFEVTDKALDFLGYRALRDLLGSMGRSSAGRHDTRHLSTGIEAIAAPKPYEFGDTLNLDPSSTILNAVQRLYGERREAAVSGEIRLNPDPTGVESGFSRTSTIEVSYEDLMVAQSEYQSSCSTVIMLDCSHSMILYGEDRFTPAKRVALALSHLIRTQYPGDSLHAVLFHDSAEEIPLKQLGRVRVGPYYTNTRAGLRLARRILERQKQDMRQIVMITDGKPSALTRPDGQIYKNAFGLDPYIVAETFAEVSACQKAGIMINTFMLARDHDLVAFVRRVASICRGKAYFTTPYTLGQYVLMDYMDRKTKTIH
ncbi:MAG TPA: VWA domain-containing protein [Vicinamibacterales bacterium]|nr:VWA domain-containing protein [Vicinamibacterales bacterium]